MSRLGNPLVYDLLEVAQALFEVKGRANLRRAALRRAVSTAYYAVFHALCYVCADELIGWSQSRDLEDIYRSVEHQSAKTRLTESRSAKQDVSLSRIGAAFRELQNARHACDYASPALQHVSPREVEGFVRRAQEAVTVIENLAPAQRRRLAILLVAKRVDTSLDARP